MKCIRQRLLFSSVIFLLPIAALAQQPTPPFCPPNESGQEAPKLLAEFKGHKFHRDVDVNVMIMGTHVTGPAHIDGVINVKIYQKRDKQRMFDLSLTADATSQAVAERAHIRVYAHGVAHVTAQRRIIFDGKTFSGQPSTVQVNFHASVDSVRGHRDGILGAATGKLARPIVKSHVPEGERIATELIRAKTASAFEEETDKLLKFLNKLNSISLFQSPGQSLRRESPVQQLLNPRTY